VDSELQQHYTFNKNPVLNASTRLATGQQVDQMSHDRTLVDQSVLQYPNMLATEKDLGAEGSESLGALGGLVQPKLTELSVGPQSVLLKQDAGTPTEPTLQDLPSGQVK
jgi:hypothetical protein